MHLNCFVFIAIDIVFIGYTWIYIFVLEIRSSIVLQEIRDTSVGYFEMCLIVGGLSQIHSSSHVSSTPTTMNYGQVLSICPFAFLTLGFMVHYNPS